MTAVRAEGGNGFALILVVWFLVLIGAIGAYLLANGRSEVAVARNEGAAASAEALADAGIARVLFNQSDPAIANRWKLDGTPHQIRMPAGAMEIRLADETQKINPNLASANLLAALFEIRGVERAAARRLGAAVADWVNTKDSGKEGAPRLDPYRAAGRSYGAPHAPLESLDELALVLGMTPEILATVRPYLTIHTEAAAPDAKLASSVIQRAIALTAKLSPDEGEEFDLSSATPATPAAAPAQIGAQTQPASAQPGAKPATGEDHLVEVEVVAKSRNGGVFVRYAVLRLRPEGDKAYSVLDWRRGALDDPAGTSGK